MDRPQDTSISQKLEASLESNLGAYFSGISKSVLFRDDLFISPEEFFGSKDISSLQLRDGKLIRILDRQVTGQEWTHLQPAGTPNRTRPRVVFYGVKGGVGRSTALAMTAYNLASAGKRVLLIDLDLESPGLSGLLLPQTRHAEFGVVDWLMEDAVGQGERVLNQMTSISPLSDGTAAEIKVVAASGFNRSSYLDKLSRAYGDTAQNGAPQSFTRRISSLVDQLEDLHEPDIVLIDSRAGLHDLAALSIVSLASIALLFATDTQQSWQGYGLLFKHWQQRPEVAKAVREKLVMVNALFPDSDQLNRAERFLEKSHELFSSTLYDEDLSGSPSNNFNFGLKDEDAPHFPLRIKWDARLQEFNPLLLNNGIIETADIDASFGNLFAGIKQMIGAS